MKEASGVGLGRKEVQVHLRNGIGAFGLHTHSCRHFLPVSAYRSADHGAISRGKAGEITNHS